MRTTVFGFRFSVFGDTDNRQPTTDNRRSGFTLIEVMVALGILVLGIGGVLAMFMAASNTHRLALDETIAAMIGESELEQYRADFNRGLADPDSPAAEPRFPPGFPLHTCLLRPTVLERSAGRPSLVYIEAEVGWQRYGKPARDVYRTIIFRE